MHAHCILKLEGDPGRRNLLATFRCAKTRILGLYGRARILTICLAVMAQCRLNRVIFDLRRDQPMNDVITIPLSRTRDETSRDDVTVSQPSYRR